MWNNYDVYSFFHLALPRRNVSLVCLQMFRSTLHELLLLLLLGKEKLFKGKKLNHPSQKSTLIFGWWWQVVGSCPLPFLTLSPTLSLSFSSPPNSIVLLIFSVRRLVAAVYYYFVVQGFFQLCTLYCFCHCHRRRRRLHVLCFHTFVSNTFCWFSWRNNLLIFLLKLSLDIRLAIRFVHTSSPKKQ